MRVKRGWGSQKRAALGSSYVKIKGYPSSLMSCKCGVKMK